MKEYLISCIVLSLIAGISLHLSHRELLPGVRMAAGVLLLSFVIMPLGGFFRTLSELELPSFDGASGSSDGITAVGEEAFLEGIARALSQRFGAEPRDFSVSCSGFSLESLSAERVRVVLSGRAALLDYRAVEDYIEENLEVGECECEIKIG